MEKIIIIIVFGFAWGSFLNVLIYRIPRDMSIIKPASSCPSCRKKIKVYDNIPIISYLILGGSAATARLKFLSPIHWLNS